MTDRPEITEPDWRHLTERTDYRVLTFPDGSTLDTRIIAAVRIVDDLTGRSQWPRRCRIDVHLRGDIFMEYVNMGVEPDAVFEAATRAHRMHGGRL